MTKILLTGATGQIGSELLTVLREKYGKNNVVATIHKTKRDIQKPVELLDVENREQLEAIVEKHGIDTIYHLAAMLSAKGEENPQSCFRINVNGTYNVLEVARKKGIKKVISVSSIAVFGPETPDNPGDIAIQRPKNMYGVSKVLLELLGDYYHDRYGLDIRSLRLPGIISWKTPPGGGTTDYAVESFYEAIKNGRYTYFVRKDTTLPMMYMPDTIKAFLDLEETDGSRLSCRCYNVTAFSFSAGELTEAIKKFMPEFKAEYKPDGRQKIADSWPKKIDDSRARSDWGWKPEWTLESMAKDMIGNLTRTLKKAEQAKS